MAPPANPIPALDIQALFNRIAPVYDDLNQTLSLGLHWVWKRMAVAWSGAGPGDRCLDLCCGTGDLALLLGRQVGPTGQVMGVDFAAEILAIAQGRAAQQWPRPPIIWQQGDALALPFGDRQFDAATLGYGLRNLTDIPQGLRELHRVLKPGAKVAILDFHRPQDPAMAGFQTWYLQQLVEPLARQRGLGPEYAYIGPSVDRFPQGPEQVSLARAAGFSHAVHYPLLGGLMGILVATR